MVGNFRSQQFAHVGNYLWLSTIIEDELHKYFAWIKETIFIAGSLFPLESACSSILIRDYLFLPLNLLIKMRLSQSQKSPKSCESMIISESTGSRQSEHLSFIAHGEGRQNPLSSLDTRINY